MLKLNKEILSAIAPRPRGKRPSTQVKKRRYDKYVKSLLSEDSQQQLNASLGDDITRLACFMGQCVHETGNFTVVRENLYYTTVGAVRRAWGPRSRKHSDEWIKKHLLRNPRGIANWAYNGREGNRDGTDDGYNYRGGGLFQTTHRNGYRHIGKKIRQDLLNKPKLIEKMPVSLSAALEEWNGFDGDKLAANGDIRSISRILNTGSVKIRANGEKHRDQLTRKAQAAIIQSRLNELGYPTGAIDGMYGHQTGIAMTEFMLVHDISAGGNELEKISGLPKKALAMLASEKAKSKPISEGRRNATVKDMRETGSTETKTSDRGIAVGVTGATGAVLHTVNEISKTATDFQKPVEAMTGVANYAIANPTAVLILLGSVAVGVGAWVWRRKRLDHHRSGRSMWR